MTSPDDTEQNGILAALHAAIEEEIGHKFQPNRSMAQIIELAGRADTDAVPRGRLCAATAAAIGGGVR